MTEKKIRVAVTTARMEAAVALVEVYKILDKVSGLASRQVIEILSRPENR